MAMTREEAIRQLDAIAEEYKHDPEAAHGRADDVLLAYADPSVAAAYERVAKAAGSWWFA